MTTPRDLNVSIQEAKNRLNPTYQLPITRDALAQRLADSGRAFDEARAKKREAAAIKEAVDLAIQLDQRKGAMEQEAQELIEQAGAAYKAHFEPDPPAAAKP